MVVLGPNFAENQACRRLNAGTTGRAINRREQTVRHMIVRGIAAALGISAAAIMGASLAPAWADADTAKIAAMFEGALDASSLEGIRTGLAPAPGRDDEELRRKRPKSSDTDPLKDNRGADPRPSQSDLSSPFAVNLTLNGAPIIQPPTQNPPAATNPPPATNNPPVASNPPPAQNTIPTTNPTLGSIIVSTISTIMRRNGFLQ